jgi:hypothetical protein
VPHNAHSRSEFGQPVLGIFHLSLHSNDSGYLAARLLHGVGRGVAETSEVMRYRQHLFAGLDPGSPGTVSSSKGIAKLVAEVII